MVRGFRQIASLTMLSRVFGLVRDMAYSHFFGASGLLDAWLIAFRIPNLSRRIFGEGAASASFIPVYSEQLFKDPKAAKELVNTVVTAVFVVLAGIVIIAELVVWAYYGFAAEYRETRLILSLTGIMLPYALMVCMVAILAGVLNVHRHFAAPAAAPIVLNLFIISGIFISGKIIGLQASLQLFFIAAAVLLAGIFQLLMQLPFLRASGVTIRAGWQVSSRAFRRILWMMGPMIIGLTVTQINTLADDIIAWCLSGSPEKGEAFTLMGRLIEYPIWRGSVSHLYFAQRMYQLPLGVFGIALATALFPVMSDAAAKSDMPGLARTVGRGLKGALFIALPCTGGLILISVPLISAFFEHGRFEAVDSRLTAVTLSFYAAGLCGYFSQQILARSFYSMQDAKLPTISAVAAVCVNVVLNLVLIWPLGRAGLACATAVCSYLQVIILLTALKRRIDATVLKGFGVEFCKTLAGTLVMLIFGVVILAVFDKIWIAFEQKNIAVLKPWLSSAIELAVVVPVCGGVYFLSARILKIESLGLFTGKSAASEL